VCANCKPAFLQKLSEGADIRTGMRYAGFGIRFGAVLLDGLIVGVFNFGLQMMVGLSFMQSIGVEERALSLTLLLWVIQLGTSLAYETILLGKYGATLGKMACKIHVVTADGGRISYLRAAGRHFAKYLSSIILLIGYIMAAFDAEKRALHDRICDTRVVLD
jgi:uncharacterized RDD family membrane protein YckC